MTKGCFTAAQVDILARIAAMLRADILAATNRLRSDLGWPIEKSLPMPHKPRIRRLVGRRPLGSAP